MRIRLMIAALLLTMFNGANGAARVSASAEVVVYAKQIDIAKIDSTLKYQPLGVWLSSPQLHLQRVQWSRGDCDIRPDEPPSKRDYPLCARIDFCRPNGWGWTSLKIGTIHTGIHGRPELLHCVVKSNGLPPHGAFHDVEQLSELPVVLDAVDIEPHGQ
jgi:hypothetical protein